MLSAVFGLGPIWLAISFGAAAAEALFDFDFGDSAVVMPFPGFGLGAHPVVELPALALGVS
jgi:hypothetical protein